MIKALCFFDSLAVEFIRSSEEMSRFGSVTVDIYIFIYIFCWIVARISHELHRMLFPVIDVVQTDM